LLSRDHSRAFHAATCRGAAPARSNGPSGIAGGVPANRRIPARTLPALPRHRFRYRRRLSHAAHAGNARQRAGVKPRPCEQGAAPAQGARPHSLQGGNYRNPRHGRSGGSHRCLAGRLRTPPPRAGPAFRRYRTPCPAVATAVPRSDPSPSVNPIASPVARSARSDTSRSRRIRQTSSPASRVSRSSCAIFRPGSSSR